MTAKFKGKYRIESTRLRNWDYGWNASYFVTICTRNRICFFGNVKKEKMILNDLGLIARDCWMQIPEHFPFVKLGEYVVMPNHVHGIVVIDKPRDERNVWMPNMDTQNVRDAKFCVSDGTEKSKSKNKFGPQSQNLASIIRGFKIGVTKNARLINSDFAWQTRFHDHIIWDYRTLQNVSRYIIRNPMNWKGDDFFDRQ